jgi:hypothetical protein
VTKKEERKKKCRFCLGQENLLYSKEKRETENFVEDTLRFLKRKI